MVSHVHLCIISGVRGTAKFQAPPPELKVMCTRNLNTDVTGYIIEPVTLGDARST
jgi:hypothetical protein